MICSSCCNFRQVRNCGLTPSSSSPRVPREDPRRPGGHLGPWGEARRAWARTTAIWGKCVTKLCSWQFYPWKGFTASLEAGAKHHWSLLWRRILSTPGLSGGSGRPGSGSGRSDRRCHVSEERTTVPATQQTCPALMNAQSGGWVSQDRQTAEALVVLYSHYRGNESWLYTLPPPQHTKRYSTCKTHLIWLLICFNIQTPTHYISIQFYIVVLKWQHPPFIHPFPASYWWDHFRQFALET